MSAKRRPKKKKSRSQANKSLQRPEERAQPPADEGTGPSVSGGDKKQGDKERMPPQSISGRRLWLFRFAALTVVPILLLLLAELSLRMVGYGFPTAAIVKYRPDGKDSYCDNVKFGWRFFPRNIARHCEPFIFPADKPPDTYRIFVLGASAARGEPDPAFSFGRVLQPMLQARYPAAKFELINTAIVAINSHVVLEIIKDCARCDPDLFIVYLGNNEVTGPYGAGTVYTLPSANLPLIRLGIALKTTRLGQLLSRLVESAGAGKNLPKVWRGLGMFLDHQVRADSPDLEAVYRNFQRNLEDISRVAGKSGAKIIFCTVGGNLKDSPPFASLHRPDLTEMQSKEWDEIYRQGVEHESAGEYTEAMESYLAAARIDDSYADLQFRLGRCYWAEGQYDQARDRYVKARELDTLRFRADTRINSIIRDVAGDKTAKGIYLTDTAGVLEKNSPHETPGQELFYEHVHLNFAGTYLLAETIFEQVQRILPPQWSASQRADDRPTLTRAECAARLAFTDWDRYETANQVLSGFIKQPPFTNQLYQKERLSQMEQDLEALKIYLAPDALAGAASEYRQAIEKTPTDWHLHWKYGKLLTEVLKDYPAAAQQYRLVQKYVPHSHLGYSAMGAVALGLGDFDSAIEQYGKAVRIRPTSGDAHYHIGWAHQMQGKTDEAVKYYSQAMRLEPDYVPTYNNLAEILYRQGKADEAIEICRKGLIFSPDSSILHGNLGTLLNVQGQRDEAIKELRTALELDPDSAKIRKMLEAALNKPD
ncbi:MAG: tetratricopeptide repeat protein [Planctomycetota bacterium]